MLTPAADAFAQALDSNWGSDHVGKPVLEFASGDECLFCHRDVGPAWPSNRHGQTVRSIDPESESLAALGRLPDHKNLRREVELLLGGPVRQRFLRRSMEHGKLDLLSVEWKPAKSGPEGVLIRPEQTQWDNHTFGQKCAGCHATGVDSTTQTFAAASLDCFTCHGEVPDQHTTKASLVFLSPLRQDSAAVVTSICASCHLRTGKSRSSGLPYPNNFVPGDNLFRDFQVDLSDAAIQALNPGDRHVQENVRDVVVRGREDVTCLSCHDVHKSSGRKHHLVADGEICLNCHTADSKKSRQKYEVHSAACQY
jgi:predicted CXXCH cytochrome family protein